MIKNITSLLVTFLVNFSVIQAQWIQLNQNIVGESSNDSFGQSVSLSEDGNIIAVGGQNNRSGRGHVRVYQSNSGTWTQIGLDIDGENPGDFSGISSDLSRDGLVIAIGAIYNDGVESSSGHARIYRNNSGTWAQIGQDIDGEFSNDNFGRSVSLNYDGSIVAIGAPFNGANSKGHVRVFQNNSGTWAQIGQDIDGKAAYDLSGIAVSLSSDGFTLAIGAYGQYSEGNKAGKVRMYRYNSGIWTQMGQDIIGETEGDQFGQSVSLNDNGTVVAIGGRFNDEIAIDSGHVRVYQNNSNTWTQIGEDIDGENAYDNFGRSVSLSADGNILAIGADLNVVERNEAGYVKIYKRDSGTWTQIDETIYGEVTDDAFGRSVSLNSNGDILAIGGPDSNYYSHDEGYAKVYQNDNMTLNTENFEVLRQSEISIYPTLTNGIINIDLNTNIFVERVEVYTLGGIKVFEKIEAQQFNTIDLSNLAIGIYIVKIKTDNQEFISKIGKR